MADDRSPRFPMIGLAEAIGLAKRLWKAEKRTPVDSDVLSKAWGYKGAHGPARRKIGALRQFGLLRKPADSGYVVSERAIELAEHPEGSPEWVKAMLEAASAPKLFAEVRKTHADASGHALRAHLITKLQFTPGAANEFVSSFTATMDLVRLHEKSYTGIDKEVGKRHEIKVEDYIQWSPQGVDQFETPKRVAGLSDDGKFVFVEDSQTGIPMEQVSKMPIPTPEEQAPLARVLTAPAPGLSREVSNLAEGEAVLQWPGALSAAGVLELEDWLGMLVRKLKRRAGLPEKQGGSNGEPARS